MSVYIWSTEISNAYDSTTWITWVYIRPNGTEQKIRPAKWEPWADTVAYYPLTSTTTNTDQSGNWHTLTTFNWITFETLASWKSVARFNGSSSGNTCKANTDEFSVWNTWTLSIWANLENNGGSYPNKYILFRNGYQQNNNQARIVIFTAWYGYVSVGNCWSSGAWDYMSNISPITDGDWHHYVCVSELDKLSLYIDWSLVWNNNTSITATSSTGRIYIASNDDSYYWCKWLISEAIVDEAVWSASDVAKYYNDTKADYWIS